MGTKRIQLVQCIVNRMGNFIMELLFPRFCVGCGYLGTYVCPLCETKLERVKKNRCYYCDKASPFGLTHPGCKKKDGIDGHLSLYLYTGLFKKILHESKYKGAYHILTTLLSFNKLHIWREILMWKQLFSPLVVSVPLHPNRLKQRGFNQSEIIAEKYTTMGLNKGNCLLRVDDTPHLANIKNKNTRKHQIRGAFKFEGEHVPPAVLLVDDVVTSGATLLECAKTLKQKGVQTVLTISLAKG